MPDHLGPCQRCGNPGTLTAYWGPVLCAGCAHYLAAELDRRNAWPPVPWDDDEEVPTP